MRKSVPFSVSFVGRVNIRDESVEIPPPEIQRRGWGERGEHTQKLVVDLLHRRLCARTANYGRRKFSQGSMGWSFIRRSSLMKSFTGRNGVEGRERDGWEWGKRDLTVDTNGGWWVGKGPWMLAKETEEGGRACSSDRGKLVQVIGASWYKYLGWAGTSIWGELVQVFGASWYKW